MIWYTEFRSILSYLRLIITILLLIYEFSDTKFNNHTSEWTFIFQKEKIEYSLSDSESPVQIWHLIYFFAVQKIMYDNDKYNEK